MDELLIAIQEAANTIATPNWADIMGVWFSLLAIIVAGFVAWKQIEISRKQIELSQKQNEISQKQIELSQKQNEISREQTSIADKQNKIALFEKRLEIYDLLLSCSTSVQIIEKVKKHEDNLRYLFSAFTKKLKTDQEFNSSEAKIYLRHCSFILQSATLFFPEEIASYINDISVGLLLFASADSKVDDPEKYDEKKQAYFEAIKNFEENGILKNIKEEMKTI